MSETPRTDSQFSSAMKAAGTSYGAAAPDRFWYDVATDMRDFGRKLEEERDRLTADNARLHNQIENLLKPMRDRATERAEKAEADNARLREALTNLLNVAENSDEDGYITDVGFVDRPAVFDAARAALAEGGQSK